MAKGVFIKTIQGLAPHNQAARDILAKYRIDDLVTAEVVKPRNLGNHRLYWALCQKVAENMDGDYDAEVISDVLKIRTGHVTVVKTAKGECFIPKSISFSALDQIAFAAFFDKVVRVVCTDVLPGVNSDDLRAEIELMLANGSA